MYLEAIKGHPNQSALMIQRQHNWKYAILKTGIPIANFMYYVMFGRQYGSCDWGACLLLQQPCVQITIKTGPFKRYTGLQVDQISTGNQKLFWEVRWLTYWPHHPSSGSSSRFMASMLFCWIGFFFKKKQKTMDYGFSFAPERDWINT